MVAVRGAETHAAVDWPKAGIATSLLVIFAGLSPCKVMYYSVHIVKKIIIKRFIYSLH